MVSCVAAALAACGRGAVDGQRIEAAKSSEWLSYGRTYDEQRFSPLSQVNRDTIGKLGVAWFAEFDTDRGQEATPLIADGVLFTTTAWSKVYAFDAKTGKELWKFDPKVPGEAGFNACCDVVNRGAAIWKGRIYVGTLDGRLIALDAKTGAVIWDVQTTDRTKPYTITGAPRVVKGKVLIGNGGAEYGVRGFVSAYDAASGALAWRFYMTPNPKGAPDGAASDKVFRETAKATWSDGVWKQSGGGGTVWDAITYDPKLDLVFVGVGNGSPWNHKLRSGGKGDNLFLSSIVALRPDTGEYVWHYQTTPGESWDYTATQHIMLADLKFGGATRRVVMQAPKNGFFYVLDAASGKLISAEKYVPVDWADRIDPANGRPVEAAFARYRDGAVSRQMSGPFGGHNWQPMAFSPKQRLVYIPAQTTRGAYADPDRFSYLEGVMNTGQNGTPKMPAVPAAAFGELVAWDPVVQKARWRVRFPQFWRSGVLATGGDLVFHAAGHEFLAFDAASGRPLWRFDTLADPIAPAVTYELDGAQYIALMVGYGGAAGLSGEQPRRAGRLLVFKLGGSVQPPPFRAQVVLPPLDLTAATPSRGDAGRGAEAYFRFCRVCHAGGTFLPNLARSPAILDPDGFKAIVLDGALKANGMAPFRRFLGDADVENLRAYLLDQATHAPQPGPVQAAHAQ
jgi:quinohemoprotein ethanol dehydrogenase